MQKLDYIKPKDFEELFSFINQSNSINKRFLAGGTDLVPELRANKNNIDCMIDLSDLGMNDIHQKGDTIEIGALTTFRTLGKSDVILQFAPSLSSASKQVGAVQTRTLATIGGNLCSAVPSLDSAPPLLVLDAKVCLVSKKSERIVDIEDFFLGPRKTILQNNEVLSKIIIPIPKENYRTIFRKIGRRKALSLSVVNGAAGLSINSKNQIEDVRIAVGAVAPTPIRMIKAEKFIIGKQPSEDLFEKAAKLAVGEISPISDLRASKEYRKLLCEVLVRRTLMDAWNGY